MARSLNALVVVNAGLDLGVDLYGIGEEGGRSPSPPMATYLTRRIAVPVHMLPGLESLTCLNGRASDPQVSVWATLYRDLHAG